MPKDAPAKEELLVISSKGSNGNSPGCTDDAYQRAIGDRADILDCPVQMTKDEVAICLGSISLSESTNVAKSNNNRFAENIPELGSGIFSFSLTWTEIQNLTPSLPSFCLSGTYFPRDPRHSKVGTFMKLTEFIVLASKTSSIAGVLINIESYIHCSMATTLMSSHTYIAVVVLVWMSLAVTENIAHWKTLHEWTESQKKSYYVNGAWTEEWFSVDYTFSELSKVFSCYSNMPKDASAKEELHVISSKGSNGNFPGCTDDAYQRAISDRAVILDCPVQMIKDGVAICLGSIYLSERTNVSKSNYNRLAENVPELGSGIFGFSLTWTEIQSLTPSLSSFCLSSTYFPRDPRHSKVGTFMKLTEFVVLDNKTSSIAGVLINIESMATTLMSSHTYIAVVVSFWMSLALAENIAHWKTLHGDEPLVYCP